jgi:hypothetical protein
MGNADGGMVELPPLCVACTRELLKKRRATGKHLEIFDPHGRLGH